MPQKILIIGATSAIAQACARRWTENGDTCFLLARSPEKCDAVAADLETRSGSKVHRATFDALDFDSHPGLIREAWDAMDGLDVCLIAHGSLGDQEQCAVDFQAARKELEVNFLSAASLLTPLAEAMRQQGHGVLAVIGSVAGDRGRQSNYVYGAGKGGLRIWLQGLRNRLAPTGVHVLTILPGFVDTPMTRDFEKGPLFVSPDVIAKGILKAVRKKRDVVYLPWFWRYIMTLITLIPEGIFKRLKL